MKKPTIYFLLFVLSIGFNSCSSDDSTDSPEQEQAMDENEEEEEEEEEEETSEEPAPTLEEMRTTSVALLTNDSEKVWRIAAAELVNANGSFDISTNFNVSDDEFVFRNSPSVSNKSQANLEVTLEWRQNSTIELSADSGNAALNENYVLPEIVTITFDAESGSKLIGGQNKFEFTISENGEIRVVITLEGARLILSLTEKVAADYNTVPVTALNFDTRFNFESNAIATGAPDMVGSLANNSIYIGMREDDLGDPGQPKPERILKFDLDTGSLDQTFSFRQDFVSKQLVIDNNRLLVVGGQLVSSYDLGLEEQPHAQYYSGNYDNLTLSRFGTAVADNTIYIVGGNIGSPEAANGIYTFDIATGEMGLFAVMPETRYGARAEIVNEKLYIFGGTKGFSTPPAGNAIYIYDLNTGELTTETMPTAVDYTYVAKSGHLIYVAGNRISREGEEAGNTIFDEDPYLAVYDTDKGTYTELETGLSSPERETIHAMAVFNDKIFIIYGQQVVVSEGELQQWQILAADI